MMRTSVRSPAPALDELASFASTQAVHDQPITRRRRNVAQRVHEEGRHAQREGPRLLEVRST